MNELLALRGVCKNYGDFHLKDVSFSVPGGCIMGFIGENGAGKTTTIRLILNLTGLDGGEISVFGLDSRRDELRIREEIGVVFDECSFHPNLSAREIGGVLRGVYRRWDDAFYTGLLERWSLPENKVIKDFSRGMKAKLSIAAALAHHPRLLVLDEATGGLDPVMRGEVLDTLQEFTADEDHAILLSSHITSDLDRIADYVTLLCDGQVVFSEEKDLLLERYGIARCGAGQLERLPEELIAGVRRGSFGCEALVKDRQAALRACPGVVMDAASLEEIMTLMKKGV